MAKSQLIRCVDGLRAFAISLVVLSHAGIHLEGKIGVEIFFVISGYLITKNLIDEYKTFGSISRINFYIRRFSRLYPSLALVACLTTIFLIISKEFESSYMNGLMYLLTFSTDLAIWLGSQEISHFFNFSWSLGVEEQFYLIWPSIFILSVRIKRLRKFFLFLLLMGSILFSFFWRLGHGGREHSVDALYFGPLSHLGALAGGCLIAFPLFTKLFLIYRKKFPRAMVFIAWCSVIGLVYTSHYPSPIPFGLDVSDLLFASIAAMYLVGFLVNHEEGLLARFFGCGFLVLIGRLSYTLYLFNILFFEFSKFILQKDLGEYNILEMISVLVLLHIFCYIVFKYYEMPLRRYINLRQIPRTS